MAVAVDRRCRHLPSVLPLPETCTARRKDDELATEAVAAHLAHFRDGARRASDCVDRSMDPEHHRSVVRCLRTSEFTGFGWPAGRRRSLEGSRIVRTILSNNKVFLVSGPSPFGPARPPEPSALLFSKRAVHPWPTPRPLRPPPPAAPLRCRNETPAAPRARAAGAASASLASRASSHVPSSHDCCRSRCASVDVLAGIACAPAGWSCAGTFASSALSATGASGLFRSLLLQSRCLEAAMFATDLRLRLRSLSVGSLPSLESDPAALAHPWRCREGVPWVL